MFTAFKRLTNRSWYAQAREHERQMVTALRDVKPLQLCVENHKIIPIGITDINNFKPTEDSLNESSISKGDIVIFLQVTSSVKINRLEYYNDNIQDMDDSKIIAVNKDTLSTFSNKKNYDIIAVGIAVDKDNVNVKINMNELLLPNNQNEEVYNMMANYRKDYPILSTVYHDKNSINNFGTINSEKITFFKSDNDMMFYFWRINNLLYDSTTNNLVKSSYYHVSSHKKKILGHIVSNKNNPDPNQLYLIHSEWDFKENTLLTKIYPWNKPVNPRYITYLNNDPFLSRAQKTDFPHEPANFIIHREPIKFIKEEPLSNVTKSVDFTENLQNKTDIVRIDGL